MKTRDKQTLSSNRKKRIKSSLGSYAKYSSLSIQMIIIVLAGAFGGIKLDQWIGWKFPVFTFLLSILSIVFAIYIAIKDFLKK
jgi:F0F1-type ATP synthase assembly protein I